MTTCVLNAVPYDYLYLSARCQAKAVMYICVLCIALPLRSAASNSQWTFAPQNAIIVQTASPVPGAPASLGIETRLIKRAHTESYAGHPDLHSLHIKQYVMWEHETTSAMREDEFQLADHELQRL